MEANKKPTTMKFTTTTILVGIFIAVVAVDMLLVLFAKTTGENLQLSKQEYADVQQDASSLLTINDVITQYEKEIEVISHVFPNEDTIPLLVQTLESTVKQYTDDATIRFSSLAPEPELDRLFLLLNITMKTDYTRFSALLTTLETLPYMTHITSITAKTPQGITGVMDVTIGMKIYVQNPFTTK